MRRRPRPKPPRHRSTADVSCTAPLRSVDGTATLTARLKAPWLFYSNGKTIRDVDVRLHQRRVRRRRRSPAPSPPACCEADAPWISYAVALTDPDEQADERHVDLVLTDGTNSERSSSASSRGQPRGQGARPGASVAEDGVTPTGWPGWEKIGDAVGRRPTATSPGRAVPSTASLEVNPTSRRVTRLPRGDARLRDRTQGARATTPPPPRAAGLASTGFAGTTIAIVAGIIVHRRHRLPGDRPDPPQARLITLTR